MNSFSKSHTTNDDDENFVSAHLKAEAECVQIKLRTKRRVPRESKAVKISVMI